MRAPAIDEANAQFWNELCGTRLAQSLGVVDQSPESLRRFDQAYLDMYPYLLKRVPVTTMRGKKVLEVGLGYGTLGQAIAEAGANYAGLDIAQGPVDMMNHRLHMRGLPGRAMKGSILDCPMPDGGLDSVVSIGCFHHTGNLARCIDEVWRVLKPGGTAYFMVYNLYSYLRWNKWFGPTLRSALGLEALAATESERKAYDSDSAGSGAPETVFVSKRELRGMMRRYSQVSLALEGANRLSWKGIVFVPRAPLLPVLGPIAGLDIYCSATK